jgi:plasmid stabilization system protein ParE
VIRVAWHPLARRELLKNSDFYEREAGLGEDFLVKVEKTIDQLRRHPRSGPTILGENRRCRMSRYPFNLVYRIEVDRIFILALAHHKRRPFYWARRT